MNGMTAKKKNTCDGSFAQWGKRVVSPSLRGERAVVLPAECRRRAVAALSERTTGRRPPRHARFSPVRPKAPSGYPLKAALCARSRRRRAGDRLPSRLADSYLRVSEGDGARGRAQARRRSRYTTGFRTNAR